MAEIAKTPETPENEKEEAKVYQISEQVDGNIEKIKKNVDFCNEKGIPEALETGGKYHKAFSKLLEETVDAESKELARSLDALLPYSKKTMSVSIRQIIKVVIEESREKLLALTKKQDIEGIKKEFESCKKAYADKYVEYQLGKLN